jgi:hypothetical integral membrane protein (TIGR02206 family)
MIELLANTAAPPFHPYGPAHLTVIALTFGLPVFFWATARQPGREGYRKAIRYSLAGLLLADWFAYEYWRYTEGQFTPMDALPMQLCDWALIAVVIALITCRRGVYEAAYFWGLAGTLQAVFTPNLPEGFPDPHFFDFFISHSGIVISVLVLTLVERLRPHPASIVRALIWSEVYFVAAVLVNYLTGADYGFLSAPPQAASLLSDLSKNHAMYLVELHVLEVIFYLVLYAPFFFIDLARMGRDALAG